MVSEEKYDQLRALGLSLKYFTIDPQEGWITVNCGGGNTYENLVKCNEVEPTIFITPSGRPQGNTHPKMFFVPYSSHCNFTELQTFVRAVMPFKLSFIVPYVVNGVVTQRGPEVLLKSYVRKRSEVKCEELKVQPKVKEDVVEKVMKAKVIRKRSTNEANLITSIHKGKRLKGAKFINSEVIYSLPSEKEATKQDKSKLS